MSEAWEYGEDEFDEEDVFDEDDEIRMQIMEVEINEVWLEEPADEDDEPALSDEIKARLSAAGGMFSGMIQNTNKNEVSDDKDS